MRSRNSVRSRVVGWMISCMGQVEVNTACRESAQSATHPEGHHALHVFLAVLGCVGIGVVDLETLEELALGFSVICRPRQQSPSCGYHQKYARSLVSHGRGHLAHDNLHHCQMLEIVVGLEERITREELDEDAAD